MQLFHLIGYSKTYKFISEQHNSFEVILLINSMQSSSGLWVIYIAG